MLMNKGDKIFGILGKQQISNPSNEPLCAYVKVALAADDSWEEGSNELPRLLTPQSILALIDTGADSSVIDIDMARKLNLTVVGFQHVVLTGAPSTLPIVFVQICFVSEGHVAGKHLLAQNLRGLGGPTRHQVILGMDFLLDYDIHIAVEHNIVELTYLGRARKE